MTKAEEEDKLPVLKTLLRENTHCRDVVSIVGSKVDFDLRRNKPRAQGELDDCGYS